MNAIRFYSANEI